MIDESAEYNTRLSFKITEREQTTDHATGS